MLGISGQVWYNYNMISQLTAPFVPWDSFSARVLAAWRSCDGTDQQWQQNNTRAALSVRGDGFAVLAAHDDANWEELILFLQMQPWNRLQCAAETAARLYFETEWTSLVMRFVEPKLVPAQHCCLAADPREVYEILTHCGLEVKHRNDWMADLARQWRCGTAKTWMLGGACTASAAAVTGEHIWLAAVGTLPEHRGQGLARQLVAHVCAQFNDHTVWLTCREELCGFYETIGFVPAGEMATLRNATSQNAMLQKEKI